MSPQPEWTVKRTVEFAELLRREGAVVLEPGTPFAEQFRPVFEEMQRTCRMASQCISWLVRQQQPAVSASDRERAEHLERRVIFGQRQPVTGYRITETAAERSELIAAEFAAVRAAARRAALEEAAAACDSLLPNPEPYTPDVHSGADWRAGLARAARVIRALTAQEVKP